MMLSRRVLLAGFAALAASRSLPALSVDLVPSADTILEPRGWEDILVELLRMYEINFGSAPPPGTMDYEVCAMLARNIWDLQLVTHALIEQYSGAVFEVAAGAALDKFGAVYGEDRRGEPDAAYRERVLSRLRPPEGDH